MHTRQPQRRTRKRNSKKKKKKKETAKEISGDGFDLLMLSNMIMHYAGSLAFSFLVLVLPVISFLTFLLYRVEAY